MNQVFIPATALTPRTSQTKPPEYRVFRDDERATSGTFLLNRRRGIDLRGGYRRERGRKMKERGRGGDIDEMSKERRRRGGGAIVSSGITGVVRSRRRGAGWATGAGRPRVSLSR